MKSILRWIFDPYINIFVIAIILVHISMGATSGETGKDRSSSSLCPHCADSEDAVWRCLHVDTMHNVASR